MPDGDTPDSDPAPDPGETLLYSAEIIHDGHTHRLYLRNHTTGVLFTTALGAKAVENLPKYLGKLDLDTVSEAPHTV